MKKIFKAIDVAFSMYSKIPMPRFEWASEDMKYHLCFFPWVGAVIGLIEVAWYFFCNFYGIGQTLKVMLEIAIPIIITGGFHLDGYMDTMDAIHSYQPKEKKLEILKDPHIGAFSVICVILYMLIAIGFASEINELLAATVIGISFVASRTLSGLSLMYFKNAKNTGMLNTSTVTADKKIVKVVLVIQLIICVALMLLVDIKSAVLAVIGLSLTYIYYYKMSYKNFGGITGDLAGFYVCISELAVLIFVAIGKYL